MNEAPQNNPDNPMLVGITGVTGRMGSLLASELQSGNWPGLALAGGTVRTSALVPDSPPFFITADPSALFERAGLVIDFTTPAAAPLHARLATEYKIPLVIGTTGLSAEQEQTLTRAAQDIPVLYAANTSIGVTLLLSLVKKAAQALGPAWDIEICETHHRHKIDAPSGTALALGAAAATGRGLAPDSDNEIHSRHGQTGPRPDGAIGYAVRRGGDVPGEHTISFFGEGERLELSHKAGSRTLFAKGALQAASWLYGQPPGLYSMRDMLDL